MCVQQVGEEGTVRVSGQYYSDPEAARAADITIVMAEEIVPEEYLRRNDDQNTIPSFEVDYILECPFGAHPTGMFGRYDVDGSFLKEFYGQTRTQEGFDAFAKEGVRVHVTEFGSPLGDKPIKIEGAVRQGVWTPQLQAEYYRIFYTICFSHPNVESINIFGLGAEYEPLSTDN